MSIFFKTEKRLGLAADFLIIPLWDLFRDQLCAQWRPHCYQPTPTLSWTRAQHERRDPEPRAVTAASPTQAGEGSTHTSVLTDHPPTGCGSDSALGGAVCLPVSSFRTTLRSWGALEMFKRKFGNFLNWADTKDQGTWCTCDKIQLDKGLRITVMLKCCIYVWNVVVQHLCAILEPTTDLDADWEPNPVLTEALGKSGVSMYLWEDKKV